MNSDLALLQPYPFEKLSALLADVTAAQQPPINLGIGEPQHPAPELVLQELRDSLPQVARYPATRGIPELRSTIAAWLDRRYGLAGIDSESQVLPVNGTREALFAFAQAVVDRAGDPLVLSPNPFYQIYEGAALLAGAELQLLDCRPEHGLLPDFDAVPESTWQRCQLLYLCSPGNPTGAVIPRQQLQQLVELAHSHDFVIASDECYAEIYPDQGAAPAGLLEACAAMGNDSFSHCVVFQSLSKRSNLPGLRSGFVAGDAAILAAFLRYRTYHGCAMPLQHQRASVAAWSDEIHVQENRRLYQQKFDAVLEILDGALDVQRPQAGFYLWPRTPLSDTEFARELYRQENVIVLPGQFLGREGDQGNPGAGRVRMALVAEQEQCEEAARRIRRLCETL